MPKFELYKHNDELFNIYYGIFYELWTFADFDRLCKLEKRGDEIKKNLLLCQRRPVSKMAAITKNRNFFKWPKLLYFKPESAQIWTV